MKKHLKMLGLSAQPWPSWRGKRSIFGFFLVILAISFSARASAQSGMPMKRLPTILHVGVVPVQWHDAEVQGTPPTYITNVEQEFSLAVRESHRFRVLDDDLVRTLWDEPKGRTELVSQYQMQAMVSLSMSLEPDTVRATVRLLSPQMEVFLQESETFGAQNFMAMNRQATGEALRKLVFRVFNRLPVDVYVTSVQGKYVTLSGGEQQGVQVGDQVDMVRPFIAARHPANGTWVKFNTKNLGLARVIDVKNFAAVAEVTSLTLGSSIEVGDAAKIAAIESRAKFARARQRETFLQKLDEGPVIIPPNDADGKPLPKPQPKPLPATKPKGTTKPVEKSQEPAGESEAPASPQNQEGVPPNEQPDHQEPSAQSSDVGILGFPQHRISVGPDLWSASGDASASAKFPFWLASYAGIDLDRRSLAPDVWLAGGANLGLGQTGSGSFFGYGLNGRAYYESFLDRSPNAPLAAWRAGGGAFLDGMRVNGQSFGGMDMIRLGTLGGLRGRLPGDDVALNWDAELKIYPLVVGRVGTNGTLKGVKSAMGWDFQGMLLQPEGTPSILGGYRLGGGIGFGAQPLKGPDEGATLKALKLLFIMQK